MWNEFILIFFSFFFFLRYSFCLVSMALSSAYFQGSYAGSVERVRQNFQTKQKTSEDAASIAPSEKSLDSKVN